MVEAKVVSSRGPDKKPLVSNSFFMKRTKMPSIFSFSTILCFYGGKLEMRKLLFCLAKGGRDFFNKNVKNGYLFRVNVRDCNHIHLENSIVDKYFTAK